MTDKDEMIDKFERHFSLSWSDPALMNVRTAWVAAWRAGRASLAANAGSETAAPPMDGEIELIEKAVQRVGIKSLLNHGAGSLVWSEGVQGVTQDDLLAYTREIALHCAVALGVPSPAPAAMPDLTALTERGAVAWAGVDAQALREGATPWVDDMSRVAQDYAHRLALALECVLLDYPTTGRWWDSAVQVLGDYKREIDAIHNQDAPTHMGEPVLKERA